MFIGILVVSCKNTDKTEQNSKLLGHWVNVDDYQLSFTDASQNYVNLFKVRFSETDTITKNGEVLTFLRNYSWTHLNRDTNKYVFKISKVSDSFLYLTPISKFAGYMVDSSGFLKFIRKAYLQDKSIRLEKIIFHSSLCFGTCPKLDIEIDSNHMAFLKRAVINEVGGNWNLNQIKSGNFKGKLTDSSYNELVRLLQSCFLRDLKFPNILCCDASVVTLIIYYNGQRKVLRSMTPPLIADGLITYFRKFGKNPNLKGTTEKFEIEDIPE